MIPLKLRIQNFLSYGTPVQTIDFNHYKLICLSGKNGHGKSALLDAMTWALWGQARKTGSTSKADSGILKLGQTDVMVVFDFAFNSQTYRVKRVFSTKYGKPKAHLDFGTYNPEDDYFTPLTEKTIRATQACIDSTLGVDYEAFINSSFLRQGQANEFSKKSPKDRKEVLATILGLHRYEKAKKLALEKARSYAQEKEALQKLAEHLHKECEQAQTFEKQLAETQKELTGLEKQKTDTAQKTEKLEAERKLLQQQENDKKLLLFEAKKVEEAVNSTTEQFKTTAQEWKKTHAQLLNLPNKALLEKQHKEVITRLQEHQKQIEKKLQHKDEFLKYKAQEQELLHTLKKEHTQTLQEKKLALERLKAQSKSFQEQQERIANEQKKLATEQTACEKTIEEIKKTVNPAHLIGDTAELQKTFERYKTYYHKWIEQGNWVASELKSLEGKQRLSQDSSNPSCPLCEQNLSQARKRFLFKKFADQERFLKHRLARLTKLLDQTKQKLKDQHATLEASKNIDELLKKHNEFLPALKAKKEEFETCKKTHTTLLERYAQEAEQLKKEEELTLKALETNTAYSALKKKREHAEKELAAHTPQESVYKTLLSKQKETEQQLEQWRTFDNERALQEERKKQVQSLGKVIKQEKTKQQQLAVKLKSFETVEKNLKQLEQQEVVLKQTSQKTDQQKEALVHTKGALENQLKKLQEQAKQQKEYEQQSTQQEQKMQEYKAIAEALGKDGIQALLIEDALPEIEQEANELLARLTDNQTHIFIESLRDLKKGGTRETLDINISDSNGIRPYEMFSGGEAFRLDFALRIAISKLLARRAGTSLQTLIIDEGFGSQDEEGLTRIMDVLYKIQDDFEKIIIVSHLATMKDQFPVHFMVHKGPQGSVVTIKELG